MMFEQITQRQLLAVLAGFLSLLLWPQIDTPLLLTLAGSALLCLLSTTTRWFGWLLLAASWAALYAHAHSHAMPVDMLHHSIQIQARIVDFPQYHTDMTRLRLRVVSPDGLRARHLIGSWYRPNLAPDELPRAGELWSFQAKLRPVYGAVNEHGFDYARWLLANGMHATASLQDGHLLDRSPTHAASRRASIADWISRELAAPEAALARALTVGDRSQLDSATRQALAATGTAHLLAISGLHIGLVAVLGTITVRAVLGMLLLLPIPVWNRFLQSLSLRQIALAGGVLLALLYAQLSGFMVSTQRATVMLTVAVLALVLRRQQRSGRSLLLAAVLIVAINPLQLLGAGFWLSFTAVFTLWLVFAGRSAGMNKLQTLLLAQLALSSAMLMVQVAVLQQFSLLMFPVNLLAIPMISLLIMPALLVAVLLHVVGLGGADWCLQVAGEMLHWLHAALLYLQSEMIWGSGWLLKLYANSRWLLLSAIVGGFWLVLPRGIPLRWLGMCLWLPVFWPAAQAPLPGHWQAQVLDVGQGTAVAIRTANHVLVYDTGPGDNRGRDRVAGSLLPLLQSWRAQVDRIIISHGDLDHAGGLFTLRQYWPKAMVISSDSRLGQSCVAGQHWRWDGVDFSLLHPGRYLPYLKNNSSCVLLVASAAGRMLLPGDIDTLVERRILRQWVGPEIDVLLVPHHGSSHSSSPAWLSTLAPDAAIVTAGKWNRFEFPRADVVARHQYQQIPLLNTADCGAIGIRSRVNAAPLITSQRQQQSRWWQQLNTEPCWLGDGQRNAL